MLPAAANVVGLAVLAMPSERTWTVVESVLESFVSPVFGSDTVAVFADHRAGAREARHGLRHDENLDPPAGSPDAHVMTPPARLQAPAAPVADWRLAAPTPALGNVSVTTSGFEPVATGPFMSPGPLLVTVMVQVIVPLGDTSASDSRSW